RRQVARSDTLVARGPSSDRSGPGPRHRRGPERIAGSLLHQAGNVASPCSDRQRASFGTCRPVQQNPRRYGVFFGSVLTRVVDAGIAAPLPVAGLATTTRREYGREALERKWG